MKTYYARQIYSRTFDSQHSIKVCLESWGEIYARTIAHPRGACRTWLQAPQGKDSSAIPELIQVVRSYLESAEAAFFPNTTEIKFFLENLVSYSLNSAGYISNDAKDVNSIKSDRIHIVDIPAFWLSGRRRAK
ncbi:MAG: hypothetical protein OXN17_22600 [Candidatus Poribacteria bacterium]|nr:hypothetical protein [Candidatus Poribacteria bacterium]MDE0502558.1 hypothetical protein [Candidatus Poribacteria bacterium]